MGLKELGSVGLMSLVDRKIGGWVFLYSIFKATSPIFSNRASLAGNNALFSVV